MAIVLKKRGEDMEYPVYAELVLRPEFSLYRKDADGTLTLMEKPSVMTEAVRLEEDVAEERRTGVPVYENRRKANYESALLAAQRATEELASMGFSPDGTPIAPADAAAETPAADPAPAAEAAPAVEAPAVASPAGNYTAENLPAELAKLTKADLILLAERAGAKLDGRKSIENMIADMVAFVQANEGALAALNA